MKTLFIPFLALVPALHAHEHEHHHPLSKATAEMAAAANAFLGSLDEEQAAKARFEFGSDERENFHFVPRTRLGLAFAEMNDEQRALARKLVASGMSDRGLLKVETIIALESLLGEMEKRPEFRDPEKYHTSVFGEPSATGTWGWRFEGHHLSVNFSIIEGKAVSATPSFLGANPAEVREGRLKGTRPLGAEEDLARTLATALNDAGKAIVFSDQAPNDILTGADRQAKQLEPVGVPASDMSDSQKAGLIELIAEYAGRHRAEVAAKDMEKIKADLDNVRFGWAGSLERNQAYYYRIQGEAFLIEASNTQNNANHIHTVWRDLEGDFGRDALGEHHRHHEH